MAPRHPPSPRRRQKDQGGRLAPTQGTDPYRRLCLNPYQHCLHRTCVLSSTPSTNITPHTPAGSTQTGATTRPRTDPNPTLASAQGGLLPTPEPAPGPKDKEKKKTRRGEKNRRQVERARARAREKVTEKSQTRALAQQAAYTKIYRGMNTALRKVTGVAPREQRHQGLCRCRNLLESERHLLSHNGRGGQGNRRQRDPHPTTGCPPNGCRREINRRANASRSLTGSHRTRRGLGQDPPFLKPLRLHQRAERSARRRRSWC